MNEGFYSLLSFLSDEDSSVSDFALKKLLEMISEDFSLYETLLRSHIHFVLNSVDRDVFSYQEKNSFSSTFRLRIDEQTGEYRGSLSISVIPVDESSDFSVENICDMIESTFSGNGLFRIVDDIFVNGEQLFSERSVTKNASWRQ